MIFGLRNVELYEEDCLVLMAQMPDCFLDSIVTDPPYGLAFMGKGWDYGVPGVAFWLESARILKPGAHLLAFGGTRTFHRLACAIEDAGFEIRDCLSYLYGSGFPKSLDVSKAIDKAAGAEREVVGPSKRHGGGASDKYAQDAFTRARAASMGMVETAPATDAARAWQGWGTALKPAHEPIILARKRPALADEIAIMVPTIKGALCEVVTFAKTDTPSSEPLRACGFLSIVSSLSKCLDDLSGHANRLTTATAYALTTDLKILNSSLSRLTRAITTGDQSVIAGVESDAWAVGAFSRSVLAKCERLTFTTADELAIGLRADEVSAQEESRLSPDWLPIILARKPLAGTVAANVQAHGTGALNVDGCRIGTEPRVNGPAGSMGGHGIYGNPGKDSWRDSGACRDAEPQAAAGRWPANVVLDEEAARLLDEQSGERPSTLTGLADPGVSHDHPADPGRTRGSMFGNERARANVYADSGGASRFFFTAKSGSGERHYAGKNTHPTVKPVDLMRWLCRLVTPKGGLILDPFMGSGSTGVAALAEGFRFIGIEREAEYVAIARRRIAGPLFAAEPTA